MPSLKTEYEQSTQEDVVRYVNLNSDTRFDDKFYKQENLSSDTLKKVIFNQKEGFVLGPLFENNTYKLYRIIKFKDLPDTVKARHILIAPKAQSEEAMEEAKKMADSIKVMVEKDKGATFGELAMKYSTDKGSASKGGDLGWFKEGAMVKPFNDFCFAGKKGDIGIVSSQFGYHIIQITDVGKLVKKVQIAMLDKKVVPSNATRDSVFKQANSFAGKSSTPMLFEQMVLKSGLMKKSVPNIMQNDKTIASLNNPKKVVKWVFEAKVNDISNVIDLEDQWVIAKLTKIHKDGIPSWKDVKDQLLPMVIKEKKFELISSDMKSKMNNIKSLEELAMQMKVAVTIAKDIMFSSFAIPSGYEPSVIATACSMKEKVLSSPIKGNAGTYILVVDSLAHNHLGNIEMSKATLSRTNNYPLYNNAYIEILKKVADVHDERWQFNY